MAPTQPKKTKTKAKQRYLKVKRDRRKKRKQAAVADVLHKSNVKKKFTEKTEITMKAHKESRQSSPESTGSKQSSDRGSPPTEVSETQASPSSIANAESTHHEVRPRKRRKVVEQGQDSRASPAAISSSLSGRGSPPSQSNGNSLMVEPSVPHALSSAPLAAFPRPSSPPPASNKALALLGLDPALIDAEIVDSAHTIALDTSENEKKPDSSSTLRLSSQTRKRLEDLGITELFAVQTSLLPFLLSSSPFQRALYLPYDPPRDVCVSAPTGSGKTLAYVIPIVELLSTRIVTRLRALVVLPTRDLVIQVRETFEALCKGRGLKIATATGQHSFSHEQAQLIEESTIPLKGGSSKVDILICTPGRLIDHLHGTMNFSLQHLRFLVIDEADRLLNQSFQDWLAQVLAATRPSPGSVPSPTSENLTDAPSPDPLPRHDPLSPAWLPFPPWRTHVDESREPSCQKLLFSATLTRDPAKISALDLRDPKYFVVTDTPRDNKEANHLVAGETFVFPASLTERMIVCSSYQKPLILFHLIHKHGVTNALVFTKSAESTNRLVKLFECFENAKGSGPGRPIAQAYSSELSSSERRSILGKFKAKEISILVCSDLISRGIDISHVSHVVSYDAPADMRKYVHRVGRTARAGRPGDAWALIEEQEARYFKSMLSDANHLARVRKLKVSEKDLKDLKDYYETAMKMYTTKQGDES